jgi:hypothetical protein
MRIRWFCLAATMLVTAAGTSRRADADVMKFTETGTASGSLGSIAFTDAPITFTQTADTDGIAVGGLNGLNYMSEVANTTATVAIAGIGTAALTSPTVTFVNRGSDFVGVGTPGKYKSPGSGYPLFTVGNYELRNFDLQSEFKATYGYIAMANYASKMATDRGLLTLDSVSQDGGFAASIISGSPTSGSSTPGSSTPPPPPVPEPAASLIAVMSCLGAAVLAKRRRRNEQSFLRMNDVV